MKTLSRHTAVAALLLSLCAPAMALAAGELTVADIQATTGLANVKEVGVGSIPGARGTINFAREDGKLLVMVTLGAASDYAEAAKAFEQRSAVSGLGDEAFTPTAAPWALYVRKGTQLVGIGSGLDPATGEQILSAEQIRRLATVVLSRL